MNFKKKFKLTKVYQGSNKVLDDFFKTDIVCGQYNHGILNIVDDQYKKKLPQTSNFGFNQLDVIAVTGFGNIFSFDKKRKRFYVFEVQTNHIYYIDLDGIDDFFDVFLTHEIIEEDYLKSERFNEITKVKNLSIDSMEVLLLTPYLCLGGVDIVENYTKGDFGTYLDLVSQSMPFKPVIDYQEN